MVTPPAKRLVFALILGAVPLTEKGFRRRWYAATRADDPEPAFQRDLLVLLRTHLSGGPVMDEAHRIA